MGTRSKKKKKGRRETIDKKLSKFDKFLSTEKVLCYMFFHKTDKLYPHKIKYGELKYLIRVCVRYVEQHEQGNITIICEETSPTGISDTKTNRIFEFYMKF